MSPPNSGGILTHTLTPDNPSNTTITNPAGDTLYAAETLFPRGRDSSYATTHVFDSKGQSISVLECKDISSDRIVLGEKGIELDAEVSLKKGKEVKLTQWIKPNKVPHDTFVSIKYENARKYKWKDYDAEDTIETLDLHASDDSSDLIAQFRPSHARPDTSRRPAQLLLAPRAQEMMDIIVTSFLFLEKQQG